MDDNRIYISDDKVIAGVCGGIAEKMNIDPTLVRIAVVILAFLTGLWIVCLAYYLFTIFLHVRPGSTWRKTHSRRKVKSLFLYSLIIMAVFSPIFGGVFYMFAIIFGITASFFI